MKMFLAIFISCLVIFLSVGCAGKGNEPTDNTDLNTETVNVEQPESEKEGTEENYSQGLSFSIDSYGTGYNVSGLGTCEDTDLKIPVEYNGKPVIGISENAFAFTDTIISVVIPLTIKSIESNAFNLCINLQRVVFLGQNTWIVKNGPTLVIGTEIDVSNAEQNAVYLKETYKTLFWVVI